MQDTNTNTCTNTNTNTNTNTVGAQCGMIVPVSNIVDNGRYYGLGQVRHLAR